MDMKKWTALLALTAITLAPSLRAQIREVPTAVTDAFTQQYPNAEEVTYDDKFLYVLVHFKEADSASTARYNAKGIWQWTETAIPFSSLPEAVQDGFNKSKYVGWDVDHTYLVHLPGKVLRYKLLVGKTALQKRSLQYNKRGRLISDNITMY